jgi:hypothetical protein
VFPVRYEHHIHIKWSYPCNRPWKPIGVFPVRYEHHIHIKSKAVPVTGRGGPWVYFLSGTNIIYILKIKALP